MEKWDLSSRALPERFGMMPSGFLTRCRFGLTMGITMRMVFGTGVSVQGYLSWMTESDNMQEWLPLWGTLERNLLKFWRGKLICLYFLTTWTLLLLSPTQLNDGIYIPREANNSYKIGGNWDMVSSSLSVCIFFGLWIRIWNNIIAIYAEEVMPVKGRRYIFFLLFFFLFFPVVVVPSERGESLRGERLWQVQYNLSGFQVTSWG